MARQRGTSAAQVARQLGLHRSNLSAMDAGTRGVSLQALTRIAERLSCSPGDLLESAPAGQPLFRHQRAQRGLTERDRGLLDGAERGWVHAVLLAWHRHYRARR